MSFYNNYYVYYQGASLSNKRIQVNNINFRDSSGIDINTINDNNTGGIKVTNITDSAITLNMSGSVTFTNENQLKDKLDMMSTELKSYLKTKNGTLRLVKKEGTFKLWDGTSTAGWTATPAITVNNEIFQTNSSSLYNTDSGIGVTGFPSFDITEYDGMDIPFNYNQMGIVSITLGDGTGYRYYDRNFGLRQNGAGVYTILFDKDNPALGVGSPSNNVTQIGIGFIVGDNRAFYIGETYVFKDEYTTNFKNVYPTSQVSVDYDESIQDLTSYWSASFISEKPYSARTKLNEYVNTTMTATTTYGFNVTGSKGAEPRLTVRFDSGTAYTPTDIVFTNTVKGKSITIPLSGNIASTTISVDLEKKTVRFNSSPIYWEGEIDDFFGIGYNSLSIDLNGSGTYSAEVIVEGEELNY